MLPLILVLAGGLAVLGGAITLRTLGPGYRIGRMLAATRPVPIADALRIAAAGERRFVAIEGRIDSEEEFEDAAHRPLVYRRTRLEARIGRGWQRFEESLEVVPFEVREGLDGIGVDTAALGDGLVVLTRESVGVVADLADRAPDELPRDAPARARIDQVSSIEHATVLGWPARDGAGRPVMTGGNGRPLILSTLPVDDAMRVLAGGERTRPWLATVLLGGGLLIAAAGLVLGAATLAGLADAGTALAATAASPPAIQQAQPTPSASAPSGGGSEEASAQVASPFSSQDLGGDTRSSGSGPGLVGAPGLAILAVLGVGLLATGLTLAYVKVTGGPGRR